MCNALQIPSAQDAKGAQATTANPVDMGLMGAPVRVGKICVCPPSVEPFGSSSNPSEGP